MTRSSSAPGRRDSIVPPSPASAVARSCWSITCPTPVPRSSSPAADAAISPMSARLQPISSPPTRISPSRRCPVTPPPTSSLWSIATTSRGMKKPLGNYSATDRPNKSSPCCATNATLGKSIPRLASPSPSTITTASSTLSMPALQIWLLPPAACRYPSSARPPSLTTPPAASASRSSSRVQRWCR